jgi:hypothetical protein
VAGFFITFQIVVTADGIACNFPLSQALKSAAHVESKHEELSFCPGHRFACTVYNSYTFFVTAVIVLI